MQHNPRPRDQSKRFIAVLFPASAGFIWPAAHSFHTDAELRIPSSGWITHEETECAGSVCHKFVRVMTEKLAVVDRGRHSKDRLTMALNVGIQWLYFKLMEFVLGTLEQSSVCSIEIFETR
jgi:hypothetical protein